MTQKCKHPSFAMVKEEKPVSGKITYTLYCCECREQLPYNFYEKKEWEEMGVGMVECPVCGSTDTKYSERGFPELKVEGPSRFCRNCRMCYS